MSVRIATRSAHRTLYTLISAALRQRRQRHQNQSSRTTQRQLQRQQLRTALTSFPFRERI